MDIQFIGEISYSLEQYITKYITKADKSHLTNDDFGFNESTISQIWHGIFMLLRSREIGAPEAWGRWLLNELYQCSETFVFVSTVYFKNRVRTMKSYTALQGADSKSTEIFEKDMLSTFYPERPNNLEKMSLKDYAANYVRAYLQKKPATDADKQSEDHSNYYKNDSLIKLNGNNNGYMRKRAKEALVYHHDIDPQVDPEQYYFSLLLLFKPWRKEEDLMQKYKNYQEAFQQSLKEIPQMKAYHDLKQKIVSSRQKIDHKVTKKMQQIEEEGLDSEPEEVESDDVSALDQVMNDFEEINNVGDISTEAQLASLVETLNPEQRKIYDKITNAISHSIKHTIKECNCELFQPLYLYVSGFGGTGKSYLIRAIMAWAYITSNLLKKNCKIILAAPTGISAAGINGMTLHSALSLPIEHHGKMTYNPLTGPKLQQIQALMRHVQCIMIDEISMVSNLTLLHVHLRLSDIFGSQYGNRNWFGSQNVIVFGDLLQLPPVKGDEVFTNLSEKQVKETTGMLSTNLSLFSHFEYAELTINQRQKNDINAHFKACLMRIRIGTVSSSDMDLLNSRLINVSKENPLESLVKFYNDLAQEGEFPVCLLPTRSMVQEFNNAILLSRSSNEIVDIPAIDDLQCHFKKMKVKAQEKFAKMDKDDRETAGLESNLRLSIGTRVMLRRNKSTARKLVNGSTGTVTNFKYNQYGQMNQIVIQFDGITEPIELQRDTSKIRIFEHAHLHRQQFPITCAYAITIHKSQGLSLKCVIADLGDSIFSDGQIYVALSRVQTLSGLHLININFNKIKASQKALEYYASKSSQKYPKERNKKEKKKNREKPEIAWYTLQKHKKQVEIIKGIIDKQIEDVPPTSYSTKIKSTDKDTETTACTSKDEENVSSLNTTEDSTKKDNLIEVNTMLPLNMSQGNTTERTLSNFPRFINLSNICWFNSVLQVIIHVLKNKGDALDGDQPQIGAEDGRLGNVLLDWINTFSESGKYNVEKISVPTGSSDGQMFLHILMMKAMRRDLDVEKEKQQDAAECFSALMQIIPTFSFFYHQHRQQIICNSCQDKDDQYYPMSIIPIEMIPFEQNKGDTKLFPTKNAIAKKILDIEDNVQRNCEKCKHTLCTKKTSLVYSPPFLVLHFLRFDEQNRKISSCDMEIFTAIDINTSQGVQKYEVFATIEHIGPSTDNGHYVAYLSYNGNWVRCDDSSITQLQQGSDEHMKNMYILVLKNI